MTMRFVLIALMMVAAGCEPLAPSLRTTLVRKPAAGYPALRFVEPVRIRLYGDATGEFTTGSVLIGDRVRNSDGQLLYCGPMVVRDLAVEIQPVCALKQGSKLIILLGVLQRPFERDMPLGAVEEFQLL